MRTGTPHGSFLPRLGWRAWTLACLAACLGAVGSVSAQSPLALDDMRRQVAAASTPRPPWDGPRAGPAGLRGKTIAILAEDLRNGGILGVAQGVREAAKVLDWQVKVFDAAGTPAGRAKAAADSLAARPDGIVLVGADARAMQPHLAPVAARGIPVVGWHVGPVAGPVADSAVAFNVSTDPLLVARITAMAAVVGANGRAGVVIFTDSNFGIAMAKAEAMAEVIRACKECSLLEIRDVAISGSAQAMPAVTRDLLARHGKRWTHALAINDIYFDYAVPELIRAGVSGEALQLLSAGDGSAAAFLRIQARAFQTGTVAEPLNLHGWQLADELNRLMARQAPSNYVVPVHLVTADNIAHDGGPRLLYDPDNGYREIYRSIWKR
ncbi:substrate-binding domain-containing protein [Azospira restricta]|uniref:Substrate-binding domain-containing protein n=1 Tax=Azospira restricta TaxID=404405 RepID=A0A974SP00_9RHOO|nr:substrate-binding domain-containing protein [Azospira restricta]QRJ63790.1 substrate-binding domain-containing protein [Azospira restricta]